ncbi:MAG: hypothetical protein H7Y32_09685, partial [Chloroflexales bacterium]|nr:hypothetical protein [Chloroflexales bacterium]
MCKRTTADHRQETGDHTAYEGQTTRLSTKEQRPGGAQGRWPHAWCWHLLWLLWPLSSLLNWSGQQALR